MMSALVLYGYCVSVTSSRRLERATHEDVAFRVLSGDQHPDHTAISTFRKQHLQALSGLFVQVLRLCQEAKLVKLGHVALDGLGMAKTTIQPIGVWPEAALALPVGVDDALDAGVGRVGLAKLRPGP